MCLKNCVDIDKNQPGGRRRTNVTHENHFFLVHIYLISQLMFNYGITTFHHTTQYPALLHA